MKTLKIMLAATILLCTTQFNTSVSKPVASWTNGVYCGYSGLPFYAKINVTNDVPNIVEIRNMSGAIVPYSLHSLGIQPNSEGTFSINITIGGVNYVGGIYTSHC
jgi:hypothetical protein